MSKASFTFKKSERLKKRKYIEALFDKGKALSYFPLKCVYSLERHDSQEHVSYMQFGISIPKRKIKSAVNRNLLKRRSRESWRLLKSGLSEILNSNGLVLKVFFIYQSSKIETFSVINTCMGKIIPRLVSEINLYQEKHV